MPTPTRTTTVNSKGETVIKNEGQGSGNSVLTRDEAKKKVETLTEGDRKKREELEKKGAEGGGALG